MTAMRTMGLAPVLPPEASVEESANEYVVHLVVPGFAQEELEVEIAGRFVTVYGDQTQTVIEDVPFRLHERLEERFQLPADVDTDRVPPPTRTGRWSCTHRAPMVHVRPLERCRSSTGLG